MSGATPAPDAVAAGAEADPLLGRVVNDRYRVVEAIGSGGMGRVYKAVQAPIDRVVALKVLGAGHDRDPNFYKRFFLENRKSTRLNSSHSSISYAVFCLKKKKTKKNHMMICYSHTDLANITIASSH